LNWRLFLSALGMVFLSEMGDKTQVTTMLLAGAKPLYVFYVALGSAMALITTSFLEVLLGSKILAKYLKPATLRITSGVTFSLMGLLLFFGILGD
jgi:putative Ca2+/H+ antiporter (TMEM165/GDT1 family)